MKPFIFTPVAALFLSLAPTVAASVPHPCRPAQVVLTSGITMPVVSGGVNHGWAALPANTVVNVQHVRRQQLMVEFAGNQVWVPRSSTDYELRAVPYRALRRQQAQRQQQELAGKTALYEQQKASAIAEQQAQLKNYDSPLNRPAYDQRRSVVDQYDWLGRRYHIGVFGQRIYD